MYPLHEMDQKYIIKTIEESEHLSHWYRTFLIDEIEKEHDLNEKAKDCLVTLIRYNDILSNAYSEMLIFKIKEG